MSDTQSYKVVTFSLSDLCAIEFALQERIARLEARLENNDPCVPDLLERSLAALAVVEAAL